MDKVIAKALELAHTLMEDERFVAYRTATERNDSDENLQKLIGDFSIARMNLNNAANAPEGEQHDLETMQTRVRELYAEIMANESMKAYNEAQESINHVIKQINAVITGTLDGQLPEEIDIESACSGNCSSCGGCH